MAKNDDRIYYKKDLSLAPTPKAGEEPPSWQETDIIGRGRPRVDAYERVSGAAVYPSDVVLPGMLYAAMMRCPYPHARLKNIDTTDARSLPGVRAILTHNDPETHVQWPYAKEYSVSLFDPHCRFEGEAVGAVAAETFYQAWDAVHAVKTDWEHLPYVIDEKNACTEQAPQVHESGNTAKTSTHERGDVEKGFNEADVVLEESYTTACELHTPLELHGCVAQWDGDRLTLWESTQGVYAVQERVARVLNLPLSKVRVIGHYMGGGFGSKLQTGKYAVTAALLAGKTGRPVKLFLTREETYLVAGNRPASIMTLKAGVKKDGRLTALDFSVIGSGGAYPSGGTALVDWQIRDLYLCPNVRTKATDVFINAGLARPFRAPGHPQCSWALEQMLDALAVAIDMDPVELRLKNIPTYSQGHPGNPPYTTTGFKECLSEGAEAFKWTQAKTSARKASNGHLRRGVGMAGGLWFAGGGGPPSTVILKLFSDGSVNLNMGASDIGTGTKTVMAMVAAEELGVKVDSIQIEHADTGTTQYATPSGGSKTVPTEAPTVRSAAISIKQQLLNMAAGELDTDAGQLRYQGATISHVSDASKTIAVTDIESFKKQGVIIGVAYRGPNPKNKIVTPFAAQFCEVEVNMKTGEVRIIRFLGTNESGRVMNRLNYDNQVFGGITMGIGLAMTEFRVLDGQQTGKLVNKNWHDYKLPTALDVPADMVPVPIEMPDDEANNTGAKGLGEPVTIPTAAAVANAVYDATGIRVTETPMNPVRLIRLLTGLQEGKQT